MTYFTDVHQYLHVFWVQLAVYFAHSVRIFVTVTAVVPTSAMGADIQFTNTLLHFKEAFFFLKKRNFYFDGL